MGDVLMLFRNSKRLKSFDKQLNDNDIIYKKVSNIPFYNYNFKMKNINKIMYYILYNNLTIENEEYFIKSMHKTTISRNLVINFEVLRKYFHK